MQVVSACTGSVITMWMIETGQKVKQVRGVLHCILQVSIPRLINQHLTKVVLIVVAPNQYLGNTRLHPVKAFIL